MTTKEALYIRLNSQLLINHSLDNPKDIVSHMGVVQSQDFAWSLWAIGMRQKQPNIKQVIDAISNGSIVRSHLFRTTVQTVSADDYWTFVNLCRELSIRSMKSWGSIMRTHISEELFQEALDAFPEILKGGKSLTKKQIAEKFTALNFPSTEAHIRLYIVMAEIEGLIASGKTDGRHQTWALTDGRIPKPKQVLTEQESLQTLARKYFKSHSPATVDDFTWWTGLQKSKCKNAIETIANELEEVDIEGQPMLIHKECIKFLNEEPSLTFLPPYDEYLIGYKSRYLCVESRHEHFAYNKFGIFKPVILYNGKVCGNWKMEGKGKLNKITTELFRFNTKIGKRRLQHGIDIVANFYS